MPTPATGSFKTVQRTAALPGVEILRGRIVRDAAGGGYFTQYGVAAGEGPIQCHYRGEKFQLAGRYVMLVEPGDFVPTSSCGGDVNFQAWYFTPDLMRQAAEEHEQAGVPHFSRGIVQDARIYSLVTHTAGILARAGDTLEPQQAQTLLLDVILGECVNHGRPMGDVVAHRAVRRMRDLIQEGYDQELSLDKLASHTHLNKFHALRAFKRAMGVTPFEYQRRLRVGKAQQMLRAGFRSTEVAHALSYCDQSHFVRAFRQIVRMTPGQYQGGI